MSLSEEPARKFFIKHCYLLTPGNDNSSGKHQRWITNFKRKAIALSLVWLQGIIINVSKSHNTFTLDDGSGTATVVSASDAPGFGSWIQNGSYAMVIGEVISAKLTVEIRAMKLTELLDKNAETLWILEVLDFCKFMENS